MLHGLLQDREVNSFIAGWLSLSWALFHSNVWPLIALMPAAIKLVLFLAMIILCIADKGSKFDGLSLNAEVKYKRQPEIYCPFVLSIVALFTGF